MPQGSRGLSVSGNGKAIVKHSGHGRGGKRAGAGPPGNQNAVTHGANALERLIKQGLSREHPIGVLLAERRGLYLADLGGEANISNMEAGVVDRLAKLDLFESLLDARLIDPVTGRTRRLSWARLHSLGLLRVRLGDSYARMAQALGLKRREREVPTLDTFLRDAAADDGGGNGR